MIRGEGDNVYASQNGSPFLYVGWRCQLMHQKWSQNQHFIHTILTVICSEYT